MTQQNSGNYSSRRQTVGNIGLDGNDNILNFVVGDGNNQQFFRYTITAHGGVVNVLPPEQAPQITAVKPPVSLRPRPFPNLIGREAEIQKAVTALEASQAVEFYGSAGVGKSVLLRHLADDPISKSLKLFPDGVVYFHLARQELVEDLQQKLFEAFYKSDRPFKPSAMRIRHDLHSKKALILLDNTSLSRKGVEKLWEIMPNCVFLFSSSERSLWGEGQPIQIGGVSQEAALLLIRQELGRSLTSQDQAAAKAICTSLKGHPLEILQQIASVRENKEWLADVAGRIKANPSPEARTRHLLGSLSSPQRAVLTALAALGGIALSAQQVSATADVQNVQNILNELKEKKLCELDGQSRDSRYSLSTNLLEPIQKQENLTPYLERAVSLFTSWAQQAKPEDLQRESEAISEVDPIG